MNKKLLFLSIFTLLISFSFAQTKALKRHIGFEWSSTPYCPPEQKDLQLIHFQDASYDEAWGNLPLYAALFSSEKPGQEVRFKLSNPVFIPMNMEYLLSEKELTLISDTLQYEITEIPELRRSNFQFLIVPFRKNPETHQLEQLFCVDIEIRFIDNEAEAAPKNAAAYDFPSRSPMAEGEWYKIQISESGVYKITGEDLKSMGMDIASVNPKNLKVYGLGGAMLSDINAETPNTGIQEMAVVVQGESDGVLNGEDYILFYGEGPHAWRYDETNERFEHRFNIYSDYNYYFVTVSDEKGKRIKTVDNNHLSETYTTSGGDFRMFHEKDEYHEAEGGRLWFGEYFSVNQEQSFSVTVPDFISGEPVFLRTALLANNKTGGKTAKFTFSNNAEEIASISIKPSSTHPSYDVAEKTFNAASGNISLKIKFQSSESTAVGRLDFFEIQARQTLRFNNAQYLFRDKESGGKITKYQLKNVAAQTIIWDVSDHANVAKMNASISGGDATFKCDDAKIHEFVAFNASEAYKPTLIGKIGNQNLLGWRDVESVIVAHPDFVSEAQKIADEHRNNLGLSTKLATTQEVYNEFSSGKQDVGAIRDLMRMLYLTNSSKPPQFLLLFGCGSYDYKNKFSEANFVPTWIGTVKINSYTKERKLEDTSTEASDDYFTVLDAGEGATDFYVIGLPDIAVGRFPVKTLDEAAAAVAKRLHYTSKNSDVFSPWRNTILLLADDPDSDSEEPKPSYSNSCQGHESVILKQNKDVVIDKVYADSYTRVVSPGGIRYPDVNKAINTKMNQGVLIMNYIGHGGPTSLGHERFVEVADINTWNNLNNMPFVITEACTYGPMDYKELSAGEIMFLKADGGAIGLFVSQRPTYNSDNNYLMRQFYKSLLPSDSNSFRKIPVGTAIMEAKRTSSNHYANNQRYSLFGDPAMPLAFPAKYTVVCTEINNRNVEYATLPATAKMVAENPINNSAFETIKSIVDTLRALTVVKFSGEIRDRKGALQTDFNGKIYPTVYDKEVTLRTLGQVWEGSIVEYKLWKNIIFKGVEKVKDGRFTFEFFVPKDIDYSFDYSKVNFYAYDETRFEDANGMFNRFVVGGINPNPDFDETPPAMKLYMNDTLFVNGGCTDANPILLVKLFDENGINATGTAIGHDIIGILDDDVNNQFSLNNFYQSSNGYREGEAYYPLYNLSEGRHIITVRAWDTYNNSTTGTIEFVVVASPKLKVENLYNYPNPFNSHTNFIFAHNVSGENIDITIRIYDITGRLIREIRHTEFATGYRIPPIRWNGDNENGAPVAAGCYVYQMTVKTASKTVKKSGKAFVTR